MPSVRVFSSSQTVPFHISLSSSASFLSSVAKHVKRRDTCLENPIHVFLLRRTTVTFKHWEDVEDEVLGVGSIFANPVTIIEPISEDSATQSWDGEIHCDRPIAYSGFSTSVVNVRVSLCLHISAPRWFKPYCASGFLGSFIARTTWPT